MVKEQKKSIGKNLLVVFVLLLVWFLIIKAGTTFASKNSFAIIDAEVSTKSSTVEISDFNFAEGKVSSNVVFHKIGDSVTYKLKMKNTDDKGYTIKTVSDSNKNTCVSYKYANYKGKKVAANEEFVFELTQRYAQENSDTSKREQSLSVAITFELEDEEGNTNETVVPINGDEENIPKPVFPITGDENTNADVYHVADENTVVKVNPKTNDNIALYIIIFISASVLLVIATRKKNVLGDANIEQQEHHSGKHGLKRFKILSFFIIIGAALFPTISRALANTTISFTSIISFKDKLVVTYKVNGETYEKVISYESKIELDDPEVTGYKFDRWEDKDGNEFNSETPITNDVELTAVFSPIEYTLTYNLNDGVVDPENPTTFTIESEDITLTKPTKEGYKFTGWTGTGLDDKTEDVTIAQGSMDNREYEANWEVETYSITYNLNGGTVETANPDTYTIESEDITLNKPTRDGYTFAGWTGTDLTDATEDVTIAKGTTGKREYIANWTAIEYTISYELNGGSADNQGTYTIETEDVTLNNPTRDGYTFTGWTGTGLTEKTITATIAQGSTGTREYTANWTANTYEIVFDSNGGSGTIENESMTYDVSKALTENLFTYEDHVFTGWNTQVDGNGTSYNDKASVSNLATEGTVTLYAQWRDLYEFTVTFDATTNGTVTETTRVVKEGKKVGELPTPTSTREDYRFDAWYTDQTYTTKATADTVINGETTFYAQYKYYMSTVFSHTAEVKFNGQGVNLESTDTRFTNSDYINTGVSLFSETNFNKDFEISFEIVSFNPTENVAQATILAAKYEKKSLNYPGFVFRRYNETEKNVEMAARVTASGNGYSKQYDGTAIQKVKIIRKKGKIYHSIDDGELILVCDTQKLTDRDLRFDTPVAFGAALTENNQSMRHFKGTLKNIVIKLQD